MSGEKKVKWIKLAIFYLLTLLTVLAIIRDHYFCYSEYYKNCILSEYNYTKPIVLTIVFSNIVSFFVLFISKEFLKKWLIFAAAWLLADIIWIINSPVQSHYTFDFGPTTKDSVSVWMGFFFVFSSLSMFIVSKMEDASWWKKGIYGILIFIFEVFLLWALS